MMPNLDSLVDELLLIKIAEEEQRKPWRFPSGNEWKQLGKGVLVYGLGSGLGAGAGYALRKKVLPRILPEMGDKALTALSAGGAALAGLGGAATMKKLMQLTREKRD